ncbi:uncharacterized protein LACBIDRAFT_322512 [Laccaria bicolor S238N-H82]|uniref:Predicted protein n=1 Tax=Laccaria bicolor (strain S238N-H82 / ATCC MYA-4686) TaxID=486041 RepID=B0CWJ9_LACBS|nr:uncharacterized protein LACBIDRAFT_322512 [Laccaria bicolor S238N-H82]EDR13522.1 predicted protein [Laccaria bicolor S238N-H82]|eukprot:XP_001876020.1 predicted protein [Laccaria bicolor S238N-H82]
MLFLLASSSHLLPHHYTSLCPSQPSAVMQKKKKVPSIHSSSKVDDDSTLELTLNQTVTCKQPYQLLAKWMAHSEMPFANFTTVMNIVLTEAKAESEMGTPLIREAFWITFGRSSESKVVICPLLNMAVKPSSNQISSAGLVGSMWSKKLTTTTENHLSLMWNHCVRLYTTADICVLQMFEGFTEACRNCNFHLFLRRNCNVIRITAVIQVWKTSRR